MANNFEFSNPLNDTPENLFGGFTPGAPDASASTPSMGWANGTVAPTFTPNNTTNNNAKPPQTSTATPPVAQPPVSQPTTAAVPMNFFRTDVGGYNPLQYGNQNAINSVGTFLGPTAQFGQTYNQGPFNMPTQSIVNWGGQNHNTGLVQNLINQFGEAQAMRMMQDEQRFARANGGGNFDLFNDPSSDLYRGNRFAPDGDIPNLFTSNGASPSATNRLSMSGVQQPTVSNPNSQVTNPNSQSNVLASLFGLGGQTNVQQNPMVQLLLMLLASGGLGQAAAPMSQTPQAQTPRRTNQYPLFY